jgi:hypothetical protein
MRRSRRERASISRDGDTAVALPNQRRAKPLSRDEFSATVSRPIVNDDHLGQRVTLH